MDNLTKEEARAILGIDLLFEKANAYKPSLTKEQIRQQQREELRIKDENRARELGLVKTPVFKNGIICKGKRIAPNQGGKTATVLL